jgi:hypothetical protein
MTSTSPTLLVVLGKKKKAEANKQPSQQEKLQQYKQIPASSEAWGPIRTRRENTVVAGWAADVTSSLRC